MKGEFVIWGKHLLVDNIHEQIVDMLLISEKNIKYNVKSSCHRASTRGSLALTPLEIGFPAVLDGEAST